jgi:DNA-binding NarL/FixJ family response regulator
MNSTRVLLVEDHLVVADALVAMLSFQESIEVVATATSGTSAVHLADELHPHAVVMDVTLEGISGIEATKQITRSHPDIAILMLSMHDDADTVTAALAAGASGFLPKNVDGATLVEGIHAVVRGDGYLHPGATRRFLDKIRPIAAEALGGARLTPHEERVLQQLADGKTTKHIARSLIVSEDTVKTHLRHIYQKLNVTDRVQAVAVAIRGGLIP